jgi:hypothetical protein
MARRRPRRSRPQRWSVSVWRSRRLDRGSVLGQVHRRAKRKRLREEHLEGARDAFDRLGAVLWRSGRDRLARIGGRTGARRTS